MKGDGDQDRMEGQRSAGEPEGRARHGSHSRKGSASAKARAVPRTSESTVLERQRLTDYGERDGLRASAWVRERSRTLANDRTAAERKDIGVMGGGAVPVSDPQDPGSCSRRSLTRPPRRADLVHMPSVTPLCAVSRRLLLLLAATTACVPHWRPLVTAPLA